MQDYRILSLFSIIFASIVGVNSMQVCSREALSQKKCGPCARKSDDGPSPLIPEDVAKAQLAELNEGWYLTNEGQRIRKDWKVRNFRVGMGFLQQVGEIAEEEGHHPGKYIPHTAIII